MAGHAQLQTGEQAPLFTGTPSKVNTGNSVVLLMTATSNAPDRTLFREIETEPPDNYTVVQDLVVIDYRTIQCLLVPGDPKRLQIQWTDGRSIADVREYSRRFFSVALDPRLIGVNFYYRFEFAGPALERATTFLNLDAIRVVAASDLMQAGIKFKFLLNGWRTLVSIEPGPTQTQLAWQVNFERDVATLIDVDDALNSLETLVQAREDLIGRLNWAN